MKTEDFSKLKELVQIYGVGLRSQFSELLDKGTGDVRDFLIYDWVIPQKCDRGKEQLDEKRTNWRIVDRIDRVSNTIRVRCPSEPIGTGETLPASALKLLW